MQLEMLGLVGHVGEGENGEKAEEARANLLKRGYGSFITVHSHCQLTLADTISF